VLVEPDHFLYGRVKPSDVPAIVQALRTGGRVERLVLTQEDLEQSG
jgi:(2Fe-2S) ferredoxin